MPPRFISVAVMIAVVFGCLYAVSNASFTPLLFLALAPILLTICTRRNLLAVVMIGICMTALKIPGSSLKFEFYQALMVLYLGVTALYAVTVPVGVRAPRPPGRAWAVAFMGAMALVVAVRGVGFMILGDAKVGGTIYVHTALAVAFYLSSGMLSLSDRRWRSALVAMAAMPIVPFLGYVVVILSGGRFELPLFFFAPSQSLFETFGAATSGDESPRWSIAAMVSAICLVPAFLGPFKGRNVKYFVIFVPLSIAAALLSGYRTTLVITGIFVLSYFYLNARHRFFFVARVMLGVAAAIVLLREAVPHMSFAVQRGLSFIPGLHVSSQVERSAFQTLDWRLIMWREALHDLHKYLVIGRGYAFDYGAFLSASKLSLLSQQASARAYYLTGDLHMGILDLTLNLGLPGAISFLGLVLTEFVWHWRRQRKPWSSPIMKNCHHVMLLWFTVCSAHYLLAGIARTFLPVTFFQIALLNSLRVSDGMASAAEEARGASAAAGGPPT